MIVLSQCNGRNTVVCVENHDLIIYTNNQVYRTPSPDGFAVTKMGIKLRYSGSSSSSSSPNSYVKFNSISKNEFSNPESSSSSSESTEFIVDDIDYYIAHNDEMEVKWKIENITEKFEENIEKCMSRSNCSLEQFIEALDTPGNVRVTSGGFLMQSGSYVLSAYANINGNCVQVEICLNKNHGISPARTYIAHNGKPFTGQIAVNVDSFVSPNVRYGEVEGSWISLPKVNYYIQHFPPMFPNLRI